MTDWMTAIEAKSASALASGALQPVEVEEIEVEDAGLRITLRWVSSLAAKDAAAKVAIPGGPRDPNFNPFLNPDPELTVGPVGPEHVAILNKFPLCAGHLVLARSSFAEQLAPITRGDFAALAMLMAQAGGIGLYNGGAEAGASQRHKHLQWMPEAPGNASLRLYAPGLPADAPELTTATHPALPMRHVFVRDRCGRGTPVDTAADSLHAGFLRACDILGLAPGTDGLLPPFNLLAGDGWLLVIPRRAEHFEDVSLSAVCFAGTLYTRTAEQIEAVRGTGPLRALAATGFPP